MKKVVINGGETFGGLLTPYWVKEYLKRKNIEVFIYVEEVINNELIYVLNEKMEDVNNSKEIYCEVYFTKNFGHNLSQNHYNKIIEEHTDCYIDKFDLFLDREDKDLIDIALQINDENKIKIIEIPKDIKYKIREADCSFKEYVEEDIPIRKWS